MQYIYVYVIPGSHWMLMSKTFRAITKTNGTIMVLRHSFFCTFLFCNALTLEWPYGL